MTQNMIALLGCAMMAVAILSVAGCATPPSRRAQDVAYAMSGMNENRVGPKRKTMIMKIAEALDDRFSEDELHELAIIFSDPMVLMYMRSLPENSAKLDARIEELSHLEAIMKLDRNEINELANDVLQENNKTTRRNNDK